MLSRLGVHTYASKTDFAFIGVLASLPKNKELTADDEDFCKRFIGARALGLCVVCS
jgi:hypothetical protein